MTITSDDIKTIILAASLIISNGLSIFFYLKNSSHSRASILRDKLTELQTIAFNNIYLEDREFIETWDEFVVDYRNNKKNDDRERYLKYEQYCEMIFNLISDSFNLYKTEAKVLSKIDFKSWARIHKKWWGNPLVVHSNNDVYGEKINLIINKWVQ